MRGISSRKIALMSKAFAMPFALTLGRIQQYIERGSLGQEKPEFNAMLLSNLLVDD
jgi:hypothetical protein